MDGHDTSTSAPRNRVHTSSSTVVAPPHDLPHCRVSPIEYHYDRVTDVELPRALRPHSHQVRRATTVDVNNDLTGRPQLRKKPKLTSSSTEPKPQYHLYSLDPGMTTSVETSKLSTVPSLHLSYEGVDQNHHQPPSSSGVGQQPPPLQRINSHSLQRSPSQKRPPASHSSYGVETICGPPPSYSTQRTLSQDRIRTLDRNTGSRAINATPRDLSPAKPDESLTEPELSQPPSQLSPVRQDNAALSSTDSLTGEANTREESSPETADTRSLLTPDSVMSKTEGTAAEASEAEQRGIPDLERLQPTSTDEDSKGSSSDEKKSEDLFLNIAKADASREEQVLSRADKRRSRISLPFFTSTRQSTGYKSSPVLERFDNASVSGRSEALNHYKRSSLGQHVPGALSRSYAQGNPVRDDGFEVQQQTYSANPRNVPNRPLARRYSNTNTNTNTDSGRHVSRPSTARISRLVSDSTFADCSKPVDHNATESTISTTAPSTVWDELDDLKSRIRKLELTGKLPPSSAAAMNNAERPKTATTAATTMSSSPKQKGAVTQLQSAIEGIPSTIHPNLHEALGNAKAVVSNDVYQRLQATAQDALQLSMMMNPDGYSGGASTVGLSSVSERQIRRRTESMCRSLTELAIAILADSKSAQQPTTRPGSRDAYQATVTGLRGRGYSNEPTERPPVASRVQSRLESRRTSVPSAATMNAPASSPESVFHTPPTALPQIPISSSRAGRTSSLLRSRRTGHLDANTDDEESSPSVRPVSRAMTEVGTYRQMARNRAGYSREYTAQHPMPSPAESTSMQMRSSMPTNLSTNLVSRRKYASPGSSLGMQEQPPLTPKEAWGRISIVPGVASSPIEATPDNQVGLRAMNSTSRRSLGFASRISSVSSRLRAAKAERSGSVRDSSEARSTREMIAPSGSESNNTMTTTTLLLERQNSSQSQSVGGS
ncbi:hypothetical protein A1O1_01034 [Capronia coronata CBS 617.96]|uniref:LPXTG-motif cell wall anchor domain protein n=1 Tax=Capronia coronata CBS 617.96 TaxID=1182541 RepID=W9ZN67_9EURO|nr:uncharacterized protein A1O1_01034 [Capronia coronata CBS 617.96]EXJ95909.1 hypothetical protein A1O1_01034 [Capronia coronata CBS 617.96]